MGECSVCIETYTKRDRKKVTCPSCEYEVCAQCVQRYLLDTVNDPHCMGCKSVWGREFLDNNLQKSFINKKLKEHRENILFEREKSYFPGDQTIIAREKECIKIEKNIQEVEDKIYALRMEADRLKGEIRNVRNGVGSSSGSVKVTFVRKCPIQNCKGFLDPNWECQMCDSKICSKCNEKKEEGHECDPESVQTFTLIKKDTKPCPNCGEMIYRISGCPQMWCTSCHVAFDWNTLRIERGLIHNPHYFEFRKNATPNGVQLRNPQDIPCGGLPTRAELNHMFPNNHEIQQMLRGVIHIQQYELRYIYHEPEVPNNQTLRIRYLMDEIPEEGFKRELQRREKAYLKKSEIRNILQMFVDTSSDIMRQICLEPLKYEVFYITLQQLKDYFNESCSTLGRRYSCVCPYLDNNFNIMKI